MRRNEDSTPLRKGYRYVDDSDFATANGDVVETKQEMNNRKYF